MSIHRQSPMSPSKRIFQSHCSCSTNRIFCTVSKRIARIQHRAQSLYTFTFVHKDTNFRTIVSSTSANPSHFALKQFRKQTLPRQSAADLGHRKHRPTTPPYSNRTTISPFHLHFYPFVHLYSPKPHPAVTYFKQAAVPTMSRKWQ